MPTKMQPKHYVGAVGISIIIVSGAAAWYGRGQSEIIQPAAAVSMPETPAVTVPAVTAVLAPFTRTVYVPPPDLPAIELQSLPAMQDRINAMIQQHNASRAARWNEINQANLRAAAIIACYQQGYADCE